MEEFSFISYNTLYAKTVVIGNLCLIMIVAKLRLLFTSKIIRNSLQNILAYLLDKIDNIKEISFKQKNSDKGNIKLKGRYNRSNIYLSQDTVICTIIMNDSREYKIVP
ncbi:hypothetical protein HZS_8182 [Henneguya salminicola]|nr:hypothetical protein HZS_8182 [Henneguya salminicola]